MSSSSSLYLGCDSVFNEVSDTGSSYAESVLSVLLLDVMPFMLFGFCT